jgi:hypothetical protein
VVEICHSIASSRSTLTARLVSDRKCRSDRSGRVPLWSPGVPPVAGRAALVLDGDCDWPGEQGRRGRRRLFRRAA